MKGLPRVHETCMTEIPRVRDEWLLAMDGQMNL